MYDGYRAIATAYDRFNADVDYLRWSAFIEACFDKFLPARPQIVLDLACGTGRMTFPLADRGYDMIGIDGSAEMLAEAFDKNTERTDRLYEEICARLGIDPDGDNTDAAMEELMRHPAPLFLQQDMRDFELYGTVDATVCCLDSLNYLCDDGDLLACLKCIHLYLAPGGLLVFDVNSPHKFASTYGSNAYILEDEDEEGRAVFCGWQNEYDADSKLCNFYLSVFTEEDDGSYSRCDETQTERCYSLDELKSCLKKCGLEFIGCYGGYDFSEPMADCERWYIIARAKK
jgi:SAM-dependent methyltransferase